MHVVLILSNILKLLGSKEGNGNISIFVILLLLPFSFSSSPLSFFFLLSTFQHNLKKHSFHTIFPSDEMLFSLDSFEMRIGYITVHHKRSFVKKHWLFCVTSFVHSLFFFNMVMCPRISTKQMLVDNMWSVS